MSVEAISVNPVDTKVRAGHGEKDPRVLGWDASGTVVDMGPDVRGFKKHDPVYCAGELTRPGSNQQLQLVDERIVAIKPRSLDHADSAAIPLTGLTAWEGLFDRLGISPDGDDSGKSILIIGAAGGVGSLAVQLARQLAQLEVIATASRPDSIAWSKKLGASEVINHTNPLNDELRRLGRDHVDYVFCLNSTDQHWDAMVDVIAPQGMICSIVETKEPHDIRPLMSKSAGFVWELMFTRSLHKTHDLERQGQILARLASLIDDGRLVPTATTRLSPIESATIDQVHERLVQGHTLGKIVIEGWG